MKKKVLSLMLAMVMMLSLSVTAFAADPTEEEADPSVFTKTYKLVKGSDEETAVSPEEQFTITIEPYDVTDAASTVTVNNMPVPTVTAPNFSHGDATLDGAESDPIIALPAYTSVGIYYYIISETAGTTAGVTYSENQYMMIVYVTRETGTDEDTNEKYDRLVTTVDIRVITEYNEDTETYTTGDKASTIENTYSASSLKVEKQVEGAFGDQTKSFEIEVTFTAPTGLDVNSVISYNNGNSTISVSEWVEDENDGTVTATVTINLADNEYVEFTNIPYGVTYEVTETDSSVQGENSEYDVVYTYSDEEKEIDSQDQDTVTVTNTKDGDIDTGISLDSLPYILMLIAVAAGVVVMISRRRLSDRF